MKVDLPTPGEPDIPETDGFPQFWENALYKLFGIAAMVVTRRFPPA